MPVDAYENSMRKAMGMDPLSMNDANYEFIDAGKEKIVPVFSDKEQVPATKWNMMNALGQSLEKHGGTALLAPFQQAVSEYMQSMNDPTLPKNFQRAQLEAADTQAPLDANVIAKAIERRHQLGRK